MTPAHRPTVAQILHRACVNSMAWAFAVDHKLNQVGQNRVRRYARPLAPVTRGRGHTTMHDERSWGGGR